MAGAKKKRGPAGGTAAPQNAEEGRRTPLASDVREARFESAALHKERCDCRKCRDAAIRYERQAMQTLSDLFETHTGHAVDFTAWSLDCLVRILRHPNELLALMRVMTAHTSLTSEYGRGERKARRLVLGDSEKADQVRQMEKWKINLATGRMSPRRRAELQRWLAEAEVREAAEVAAEEAA